MKQPIFLLIAIGSLCSCQEANRPNSEFNHVTVKNISDKTLSNFQWINQPDSFEISDSSLVVEVAKGTDYFNNPEDGSITASAPFLYKDLSGNFIVRALVQPDFNAQWNAVALMVHIDSLNWIKFAFENSDATGPSIVTVVTNQSSDDANGVILDEYDQIWLALVKKNNIYSMHWSTDNVNYKMARLTAMPTVNEVKIGLEFQSPVGDNARHMAHFFHIEERTIENPRELN